jgi:hypothetical protein
MRSRHYLISAGLATAQLNPGLKNSTYKSKSPISALFAVFSPYLCLLSKYSLAHNVLQKKISAGDQYISWFIV